MRLQMLIVELLMAAVLCLGSPGRSKRPPVRLTTRATTQRRCVCGDRTSRRAMPARSSASAVQKSEGVPNYVQAMSWYRKAAEQGHAK